MLTDGRTDRCKDASKKSINTPTTASSVSKPLSSRTPTGVKFITQYKVNTVKSCRFPNSQKFNLCVTDGRTDTHTLLYRCENKY